LRFILEASFNDNTDDLERRLRFQVLLERHCIRKMSGFVEPQNDVSHCSFIELRSWQYNHLVSPANRFQTYADVQAVQLPAGEDLGVHSFWKVLHSHLVSQVDEGGSYAFFIWEKILWACSFFGLGFPHTNEFPQQLGHLRLADSNGSTKHDSVLITSHRCSRLAQKPHTRSSFPILLTALKAYSKTTPKGCQEGRSLPPSFTC